MANWVTKRLAQSLFTVFAVANLSFVLTRLIPGGPADYIRQQYYDPQNPGSMARADRMVELYTGLNPEQPMWVQYIDYMSSLAMGDLGRSMWRDAPVTDILAQGLPWTLLVMSVALVVTFVTGIVIGAVMSYYEGGKFDLGMTVFSTVQNSIPYYVAAILLAFVLAYNAGWFPTGGRYPSGVEPGLTVEFIGGALYHAALPITSMIITGFAGVSLTMRGNGISVLGEDYVRVARLRGLSPSHISLRYVMRNAILPMYTGLLLSIGFMFGGSIILEEIFNYRGIGWYTFKAVESKDYPLMMGGFILITIAVVIAMIIADITYGKIDPRAKGEGSRETFSKVGGVPLTTQLRRMLAQKFGRSGKNVEYDGGQRLDWLGDEPTSSADISRGTIYYERFDRTFLSPGRIVWSDYRGKLGIFITGAFLLTAAFGRNFVAPPHEPAPILLQPFQDWSYPLGTDMLGQDLLSLMVYGTDPIVKMVIAGGVFTAAVGVIIGTYAGFVGGNGDRVLMTLSDIAMTLPGLPLVIVIAVILEPQNPFVVGIIISINAWGGLARSIRSEVLSIRDSPYIEASRSMGMYTPSILWQDILPNLWPYILINLVQAGRRVIFSAVGLYFLGFLPITTQNWGVVLNLAYDNGAIFRPGRAHWLIMPMLAIILFSMGLILLSQSLDRVANPRIRAKHAKTVEEGEGAPE